MWLRAAMWEIFLRTGSIGAYLLYCECEQCMINLPDSEFEENLRLQ